MFGEQIQAGMALLDRVKPGWKERVHLSRLNIGSCRECILGQVYGGFIRGRTALGLEFLESVRYGFVPPLETRSPSWWRNKQLLTEEWRSAIKARQKG